MDERPQTEGTQLTPEIVFREFTPRVYNLARRMLGNDADAEDVTQDVLLQVVRKLDTFRGESAFPTWLHRVTVNAALANRRKSANRQETQSPELMDEFASGGRASGPLRPWSIQPDQAAIDKETQTLIERSIENLPEPFRDVYVLADVEGLPNAEIAEMLDLSVPAVKSRLHRARLAMRDRLAPHFEESAL
jgi:RNA polymerase sigma-70 factor (ECF subfamily)